jgi:hypothetical protein
MTHIRTQIRHTVIDALAENLPSNYRVFGSRKYAINHKPGSPVVDVRFMNVNITQETMGNERRNAGSLYIRVQRDGEETALDDQLDADEVLIVGVMASVRWDTLLEENPELVQANFAEDAQSGRPIGALILRFDVEWRANWNDPETVME